MMSLTGSCGLEENLMKARNTAVGGDRLKPLEQALYAKTYRPVAVTEMTSPRRTLLLTFFLTFRFIEAISFCSTFILNAVVTTIDYRLNCHKNSTCFFLYGIYGNYTENFNK